MPHPRGPKRFVNLRIHSVLFDFQECERRNLEPDVYNMRECLGPALQLVRFPLLNVEEFGKVGELFLFFFFKYELFSEFFIVEFRRDCGSIYVFGCSTKTFRSISVGLSLFVTI